MGISIVPGTGSRRAYFPKYKVQLGPFTGGLNLTKDPTLLGENELQECINYMIDTGGTLKLRPGASRTFDGLPSVDYKTYWTALGSVLTSDNNLVPVIGLTVNDLDVSLDPAGTWTTRFYKYLGGTWNSAFADLSSGPPGSGDQSVNYPVSTFWYGGKFFVVYYCADNAPGSGNPPFEDYSAFTGGVYKASTSTGTLTQVLTPTFGGQQVFGVSPGGFKALVFKDRIIIASRQNLFWSSVNPTGSNTYDWNTDPTTTPPGNAGFNQIGKEDAHDSIRDICIHEDALYILTYKSVFRYTWTTNPGTAGDGLLTRLTGSIGGESLESYNGVLYLLNGLGLYRLVNDYFIEISAQVKDFMRSSSNGIPPDVKYAGITERAIGIYRMGSKLLCGPFNFHAVLRANDISDQLSANQYLVFDMDLGVWTKWLFSANTEDPPVGGPAQQIMPASQEDPAVTEEYIWISRTLDLGVFDGGSDGDFYLQRAFLMSAEKVDSTSSNTNNDNGAASGILVPKWIGGWFNTASIDLGDSTTWKRVSTSLLDAVLTPTSFGTGHPSTLNYDIDGGGDVEIPITPADNNRLKFGAGYRFHTLSFKYDGISGIGEFTDNLNPELNNINQWNAYIMGSRKDTI